MRNIMPLNLMNFTIIQKVEQVEMVGEGIKDG
nr:MAG TPA: hypothetical protein [Caudoviricetes sp.]